MLIVSLIWASHFCGACTRTVTERDLFFPRRIPLEYWRRPPTVDGLSISATAITCQGAIARGWVFSPSRIRRHMVYFYGNGETVAASTTRLVSLARLLDCRIVAIDYPGYGFSEGAPTFETIMAVADGAYELAAGGAGPGEDVFVYGRSIGTGPAVHVAARADIAGLILEAPPTSAAEIIPGFAKMLPPPLRWFIRMRADEALENRSPQPVEEIRLVKAPLLIIHGRRDKVIPIRFGRRMYEQAGSPPEQKHFIELPLAGHNNLDPTGETVLPPLRRFVESRGRSTWR